MCDKPGGQKQKQSYWEVAYPVKNSNIKETKMVDITVNVVFDLTINTVNGSIDFLRRNHHKIGKKIQNSIVKIILLMTMMIVNVVAMIMVMIIMV